MVVKFPNMDIDFVDVYCEREATEHGRILFFEDIYNLPRPYKLIREDKETNTFFVRVY